MFILRLNPHDIRTCAAALAFVARKRVKGHEDVAPSRRISDRLGEVYVESLAKGEVYLDVTDREAFVLRDALAVAADLWPLGQVPVPTSLPCADPETVLAMMGA